jgi:5-methylcytosine-specific restriction endonuclease McrA
LRRSKKKQGSAATIARSSATLRRTGSRSYQNHRDWLMSLHGPVCAYCGDTGDPEEMTLDHVQPRKGKTAYDRPDNLVLACKSCNAAKADLPFLGFILARRARGVFLLHYGDHLSDGIKNTVRELVEKPI